MILNNVFGLTLALLLFITSPILSYLIPVGMITLLMYVILLAFSISLNRRKVSPFILLLIVSILSSFVISSLYWQDSGLLHYPKYLILSCLIVFFMSEGMDNSFLKYLTAIIVIQIAASWIGFIYSFLGGGVTMVLSNSWGREFYFYLTTLTPTSYAGFIRPSGFLDEPGALSFYICFLVTLREIMGQSKSKSYLILVFGLVTLSVAHVIFIIMYTLYNLLVDRDRKNIKYLLMMFVLALLFIVYSGETIISYVNMRMDSDLSGSGRSGLFSTAYEYMDNNFLMSDYIFGVDSNCLTDYINSCRYIYPRMGENILSPLVFGGLVTSWPLYFSIILSISLTFFYKSRYSIVLIFMILFFQRPYIYAISYCFIFIIPFFYMFRYQRIALSDVKKPA